MICTFVFPKIMPIFQSLGANLPLTTRILLATSNFLIYYGWLLGLAIAGLIILLAFIYKTVKPFNYAVSRIFFAVPIFGHLAMSYHMANFCRTFGLLLNCNLGVVNAATITANATTNQIYKREIYTLAEEIAKGRKIAQHLETSPGLFPEMVPQMVAIGETTGSLGSTLIYLSDFFEAEVNDITKNLSSSIEPVLLLFMGVIVGFVAVAVITPIYELTQNIHP
jgi:type IV pilus assembly protein PilC